LILPKRLTSVLIFLAASIPACGLPQREGRKSVVDIPFFASYASEPKGEGFGLNLLGGFFQRDVYESGSHTHFFPLFFNTEGPGEDTFLLIIPFYYHRRKPFREDTFYFLFGRRRDGGRSTYYPLFPLISFSPADEASRWSFFLFPLVDLEIDGPRGNLDILNVLGLVELFGRKWGRPPPPDETERRGSFSLVNILNLVKLAGGSDMGEYEDFEFVTLWASEKVSLFQRHWKRDGSEGRTILFPFYWHFRDPRSECRNFWPLLSFSGGDGWSRCGIISDMFSLKKEGGKKTMKLFWFIPISWGRTSEKRLEPK